MPSPLRVLRALSLAPLAALVLLSMPRPIGAATPDEAQLERIRQIKQLQRQWLVDEALEHSREREEREHGGARSRAEAARLERRIRAEEGRPAKPGFRQKPSPAAPGEAPVPATGGARPSGGKTARFGELSYAQNARVSDPALDDPNKGDAQAEPSLVAWGNYVLAAWNDGRGVAPNPSLNDFMAYSYSTNGGQSFVQGGEPPEPPSLGTWTSDPVMAVNEKTGEFYFCALFDPIDISDFEHGVATARATFSGSTPPTWAQPRVAKRSSEPEFIDKPWIAVDSLSGNLYLSYTHYAQGVDSIIFIRSTDKGISWGPQLTLSSIAAVGLVQGSRPVVGPNGEVYVVWKEIGLGPTGEDYLRIRKSTDFGVSFGPEQTVASFYDNFGTGAPGFNREQGIALPAIAVDRSNGPRRGRVYVAWNESVNFYDSIPDDIPVINEVELGDSVYNAQGFTPGATIVGSFGSLTDLDWYRFSANQGTTYIFWSDQVSTRYTLRIFCSDGITRLAFSGDRFGSPPKQGFMVWTCPRSGDYYMRMAIVGTTQSPYRVRSSIDTPGGPGQRARDHRDAFVASSTNGTSWSTPVLLHPDQAPLFDDWLPEVAVTGGQGSLYTMWYDWSDSPVADCGGNSQTYMARSEDGGATWSSLGPVTDQFSGWTFAASNTIPNQGDYLSLFANDAAIYPCWADARVGTPDIYVAKLPISGLQVYVESVEADTGRVAITWRAEGPIPATPVKVYRAIGSAPYSVIGSASFDGAGNIGYEDLTVGPGVQYRYALGIDVGFGETKVGERTVTTPGVTPPELVLVPKPNPSTGLLTLRFTLPDASPAKLTLMDLTGRKLREVEWASGPGTYEVDLSQGLDLEPGLYFIRLSQSGIDVIRRVSIVR